LVASFKAVDVTVAVVAARSIGFVVVLHSWLHNDTEVNSIQTIWKTYCFVVGLA
jgi:hypothetical protein